MEQSTKNEILTGVIWKQILKFFFPILIGAFFQQLYNTVDAIVVGQYAGTEALAAVGGSSSQITNFIFSFFMGLGTGATVIIAQYYGAEDRERVDRALHTAYTFALIFGIGLGVLGVLGARPLMVLLDTPESLVDDSTLYVRVLMAGLVFTLVYNMGAGILRAIGDSKRPLYILIASCVLNIILDILFVAVLDMGVLGAALATDLCQAFSAVLTTVLLVFRTPGMELRFQKLRIDRHMLIRILRIGLPTAIAGSMFSISNMVIQVAINQMGVDTVAAWAAYGKIDGLWWMINQAFSSAITTFVGQNYGAGNIDRIRKATRTVLLMEIGAGIVICFVFIFGSPILLRLFSDSEEVIRIGTQMAHIMAPFYMVFAVPEILSSTLRAENDVMFGTITNLIFAFAFRVLWVWLIPTGSLSWLISIYPVTWILIAVMLTVYYLIQQPRILKKLQRV